jgi:hypothetical protein
MLVENGQAVTHPYHADNLIECFGEIPPQYEPFVRIPRPLLSTYQVLDPLEPTYQKVNGVWTDVWSLRDLTSDEIAAKQKAVIDDWNSRPRPNLTAWKFNEATCQYEAPIPRPNDGNSYYWDGAVNEWKIRPPYPEDGKQYKLDIPTGTWVLVTT